MGTVARVASPRRKPRNSFLDLASVLCADRGGAAELPGNVRGGFPEQNQRCSIRGSRKCRRVETRLKSKEAYRTDDPPADDGVPALPLFSQHVLQHRLVQAQLSHQLLQARVLF